MIIEKFRDTVKKHGLIKKGEKILVALSGGPDSVALLYLLIGLKYEYKLGLHIAHLDHMLRKDSAKDAEFIRKLGKRLKIPVTCEGINIKEIAKKGSVEEVARNARLGFLFKAAKDIKADRIALGHNLDDQAETVLMRILRGTGLYGLSGIAPSRNIAGFNIIRPLIEIKRREIEAFLKRKKIKARIDISNAKDIYFRNRIRNSLIPLLEKKYNKNIKEVLANLAQSAASDYDYLAQAADKAKMALKVKNGYSVEKLQKRHPAIRRMIIRKAIARVKGDTRRITFQHIREVEDLILNRPVNSIVDLPKGISVIKKKSLSFYLK